MPTGKEHRAISDAALERDPDKACRLMELHIDRTGSDILAVMPHHSISVVSGN